MKIDWISEPQCFDIIICCSIHTMSVNKVAASYNDLILVNRDRKLIVINIKEGSRVFALKWF